VCFFFVLYVDAKVSTWVKSALLLEHIWASPNLVWGIMSLVFYYAFPLDLSPNSAAATGPLSVAFMKERFTLWFVLIFGYVGFWHFTTHWLHWAKRSFIKDRAFNVQKVLHNLFYNVLGVIQWVAFENVFCYLWATGKLSYVNDEDSFATVGSTLKFIAGFVIIPLWRDFHFYFAHRFLHYKPMFQQVHGLHHRNTDIEPFSGLCMHPVEHLYYYACILPSLLFLCSPFQFVWNGVHLVLAPAASHSGYEDHFQADTFHYMHHRYFECNYAGFGASYLDYFFGTFTDKFVEKTPEDVKQRADAKSTLRTPPTSEYIFYLSACAACIGYWVLLANKAANGHDVSEFSAKLSSFLAGFGPVIIAFSMTIVNNDVQSTLKPFLKQTVMSHLIHLTIGTVFCSVPVSWACYLVF